MRPPTWNRYLKYALEIVHAHASACIYAYAVQCSANGMQAIAASAIANACMLCIAYGRGICIALYAHAWSLLHAAHIYTRVARSNTLPLICTYSSVHTTRTLRKVILWALDRPGSMLVWKAPNLKIPKSERFRFLGLYKLQKRDSSVKNGTVGKSAFPQVQGQPTQGWGMSPALMVDERYHGHIVWTNQDRPIHDMRL